MKILLILAVLTLGSATIAYADPPAPAPDSFPPCSRTVTDNCMQTPHVAHHARSTKAHHKAMHRTHHASVASHKAPTKAPPATGK